MNLISKIPDIVSQNLHSGSSGKLRLSYGVVGRVLHEL